MDVKGAVSRAGRAIWKSLPVLVGVVLLVSLANALIPKSAYGKVFGHSLLADSVIGSAAGSILAGNPVTSYVIGGELLGQGVSLVAVTAFIVAWVTVGVVTLPAESIMLGKKFALTRNLCSFILSIAVALVTAGIVVML
ncbi:MAG: hypothetical protein ABH829_04235 [archaeon]